jgi:hypothetical protein
MSRNAQWNMSFSGEAPNTPEGKKAFEAAFKKICELVDEFSIENENHLNDNGSFYEYGEDGSATAYNVHEEIPEKLRTGSALDKPAPAPKKTGT